MKIDGEFQVGGDPDTVIAGARDAEARGYDGYFSTDDAHDPFLPLAVAARETSRIELGTAIAVAFARNPMSMAYTAHDLQLMSKGRLILGLGSQVRGHIVRRFSMPWSRPAARMREFVLAVRAIWECWDNGTPLNFEGEFYSHTLMTPAFSPPPNPYGQAKIMVAALGDRMAEVAGEVADGIIAHPLVTDRYVRESLLPAFTRGLEKAGRTREQFEVCLPVFIATGHSKAEIAAAADSVREKVSFYASTPAYRAVLELHGWADLHEQLHRLSREGGWAEMPKLVDDSVLSAFAVVGDPAAAAAQISERYGPIVDRISFYAPYAVDPAVLGEVRDLLQP
jgi:probable F420-dependent oxidoreductase